MQGTRTNISVKIPVSGLHQMDSMIEEGRYSDRSDMIMQSLYYQIHKTELRNEMFAEVVSKIDEIIASRIYSDKYADWVTQIVQRIRQMET